MLRKKKWEKDAIHTKKKTFKKKTVRKQKKKSVSLIKQNEKI